MPRGFTKKERHPFGCLSVVGGPRLTLELLMRCQV